MILYHAIFDGDVVMIFNITCHDTRTLFITEKTPFISSRRIKKSETEHVTINRYNQLSLYTLDNNERTIRQKMFDFAKNESMTKKLRKDISALELIADKINQYGLWELERTYKINMEIYHYEFNTQIAVLTKKVLKCKETDMTYIIDKTISMPKHRIFKPAVKANIIEDKGYCLILYSLDPDENNARNIMLDFLNNKITKHVERITCLSALIEKLDVANQEPESEISKYIAIDFDGTLTVRNAFPEIGEPNWAIINKAKERAANGCILILYTCREGIYLEQALQACKDWGVPITYANENPDHAYHTPQRKIVANEYWDDRAMNILNGRLYPEKLAGHNRHVTVL